MFYIVFISSNFVWRFLGVCPRSLILLNLYRSFVSDFKHLNDPVLFAVDANLFFLTFSNLINSEMLKLSDWFKANKLSLNIQKSKKPISNQAIIQSFFRLETLKRLVRLIEVYN